MNLDRAPCNHLYRWGQDVFQAGANTSASASAFLWDSIIRYGKLDGSRDVAEPPAFIKFVRIAMLAKQKPPTNRIQSITPWDREIYQRHSYDELRNPMEFVPATINYCDFVASWMEAVKQHDPAQDLEAITQWAFKVVGFLGMPKSASGHQDRGSLYQTLGLPDWRNFFERLSNISGLTSAAAKAGTIY